MQEGANYFFGFLITFVALLLIFLGCGVGSRQRAAARRRAMLMSGLDAWATEDGAEGGSGINGLGGRVAIGFGGVRLVEPKMWEADVAPHLGYAGEKGGEVGEKGDAHGHGYGLKEPHEWSTIMVRLRDCC